MILELIQVTLSSSLYIFESLRGDSEVDLRLNGLRRESDGGIRIIAGNGNDLLIEASWKSSKCFRGIRESFGESNEV